MRFHVGVADCFSEWASTIVASMSSTNPASCWPSTVVAGIDRRVSASCTQASSRAAARAARNRARAAVSIWSRTRHAVGSDATGPKKAGLLPQHRQIGDGFTAVGQQHREINRDPAWLMPAPALPANAQHLNETAGQPRPVGKIGEQSGTGVTDHTTSATSNDNLRMRTSTLHSEVPSVQGDSGLRHPKSSQIRRHFRVPWSPHPPPLLKARG
ncbi:hypothetical protein Acsp02_79140 [Actinoplanes sp. NBRC 103695]|nr:hypothetical protein Acsp02_79140 [Actinoplanes sp. NBRC 103695]